MAKYKCVPAPMGMEIGSKNSVEDVAKAYEKLINDNAVNGYEYHSQQDMAVKSLPGCLGSLLGKKEEMQTYKLFVFVKN